jgi:iron complex transport system ATP-binding protein
MSAQANNLLTENGDAMLRLQNVSFSYGEEMAVRGVSLDIRGGGFIGVIGPNGSGKSTLLKLLAGILRTGDGEVAFKGHDIRHVKRKALARAIAWIPQEHLQIFPFKVMELVLMGRHPYLSALAFEGEEDVKIARRAMDMTNVTQFADRSFNNMSGGERQRVMLASAIAQEPELMLLDEPTASLDIKYQVEILGILKRLNKEHGLTLVMALHDLHLASKYCDRLILLDQGRIVCDGPPERVLRKETLEAVYGVRVKIFRDADDGGIMISPGAA